MGRVLDSLPLALAALLRNRTQAGLAMVGVMIGVAALVTSLALGRGAQNSLNDQLLAAGANVIVITSGNYRMDRGVKPDPEANIGHAAYEPGRAIPPGQPRLMQAAYMPGLWGNMKKMIRWRCMITRWPASGWVTWPPGWDRRQR